MPKRLLLLFRAVVVVGLLPVSPAAAQYVPGDAILTVGEPVTLSLPAADTLVITYRPSSEISRVERVPMRGASSYTWTPRTAGLVSLATSDASNPVQTVSVRFDRVPVTGLFILIVAGSILFGGAAFASVKLFGRQPPETLTDRPDT